MKWNWRTPKKVGGGEEDHPRGGQDVVSWGRRPAKTDCQQIVVLLSESFREGKNRGRGLWGGAVWRSAAGKGVEGEWGDVVGEKKKILN